MDKSAPLARASQARAFDNPVIPADMHRLLGQCGLAPLHLAGRTVLPIVQGGMGIGVSAYRHAGTVASHGAVGALSAVDRNGKLAVAAA